jgi:hypothetical protein
MNKTNSIIPNQIKWPTLHALLEKKNMKKNILIVAIILCAVSIYSATNAQSYKTGLGLRFGGLTSGLTLKHFTNPTTALEGIVSLGRQSIVVTGLYEKHAPLGGHLGFFQDGGRYYYNDNRIYTASTVVGIDGILGLDFKLNKAPINISMDIKPFVDFFGGNYFYMDGGLSVRYTF